MYNQRYALVEEICNLLLLSVYFPDVSAAIHSEVVYVFEETMYESEQQHIQKNETVT